MKIGEERQVDRYQILVGLNDKDDDLQRHDTEKYVSVIEYICKNNDIAFSLQLQRGGYCYENGTFTRENSLAVTLLNAKKAQAEMLASELCAMFRQESVLILHDRIGTCYLREEM